MWESVGETDRQTDRQRDRQIDRQTADCILRKHYVGTIFSAGHSYSQGSQSHAQPQMNYLNVLLQSQFVKPLLLGTDGFDT